MNPAKKARIFTKFLSPFDSRDLWFVVQQGACMSCDDVDGLQLQDNNDRPCSRALILLFWGRISSMCFCFTRGVP